MLHPLPGPIPQLVNCSERGLRTRDSGTGGGRSTKEAKGYSL